MKTVTLYTDGACSGNPGPGGWGAILMYGEHRRELSGGERSTTNNRMELTAVIQGLRLLKEPCAVELWSDSRYVIDALDKGWARSWQKRGWVKSDKKPALNPDLWEQLLALCDIHAVRCHWVRGHAENPFNNRCDEPEVPVRPGRPSGRELPAAPAGGAKTICPEPGPLAGPSSLMTAFPVPSPGWIPKDRPQPFLCAAFRESGGGSNRPGRFPGDR